MKIYNPADNAGSGSRPRVSAYDKAREAAIEKQLSRYIELSCGHFATWESDEMFFFGRPRRDKMWCEKCGKWKVKKRPPKRPELPDEPLF